MTVTESRISPMLPKHPIYESPRESLSWCKAAKPHGCKWRCASSDGCQSGSGDVIVSNAKKEPGLAEVN